jgi:hypothetical protein
MTSLLKERLLPALVVIVLLVILFRLDSNSLVGRILFNAARAFLPRR